VENRKFEFKNEIYKNNQMIILGKKKYYIRNKELERDLTA